MRESRVSSQWWFGSALNARWIAARACIQRSESIRLSIVMAIDADNPDRVRRDLAEPLPEHPIAADDRDHRDQVGRYRRFRRAGAREEPSENVHLRDSRQAA